MKPGTTFEHEYDFGSTTELAGRVVSEHESALSKREPIRLLARDDPPEFQCEACGEPATLICSQCVWEGVGLLCDAHAEAHECGEEMLLPVINSPRMSVCGCEG